jgi:hypothetical protein
MSGASMSDASMSGASAIGAASRSRAVWLLAGTVLALAAAPQSSLAQGRNQPPPGRGGQGGHGSPPSRSPLPPPSAVGRPLGTVPFSWIDDASLLPAGDVALGISMMQWQGLAASETDVPVVDAAIGLASRLQIGASAPHVIGGADSTGAAGGLGTTFVHAKIGIVQNSASGLKVAVAPALELLSASAAQSAGPDERRTQWGLPVSAEIDRGLARFYGSAGYFSGGIWYAGGGAGAQVTSKLAVSGSLSRAWSSSLAGDPTTAAAPQRTDVAGGAFYRLTRNLGVFGSLGHSIGTTEENGAGATFGVGLSFLLGPVSIAR